MKTIRRFILFLVLLATVMGFAKDGVSQEWHQELVLGLHIAAWTLFEYSWIETKPERDFLTGKDSHPDWKKNVVRNLNLLKRRGYTVLLLDVMIPEEGTYFFKSKILKKRGYKFYFDALGFIIEEAHKREMKIFAEHTILAWRLDDWQTEEYGIGGEELSIEEVKKVTATLLDRYDADGIVEESFPLEYVKAIKEVVKERPGKIYIHKFDDPWNNADIFMSEDYVGFLSSPEHIEKVDETGAAGNTLGLFNALFAHAKAVGKPGWVKVTTNEFDLPEGASHNVMLLRAVQFNSNGYFWMSDYEEVGDIILTNERIVNPKLLRAYLNRFRIKIEEKPIINFVLSLPFDTDEEYRDASYLFLLHAFGPISNGFMLAGYDIRVTYNRFLPDANGYIVFAMGNAQDETLDLSSNMLELLKRKEPAMFVVWGITDTGNWKSLLGAFGVSSDWDASITDEGIDEVTYAKTTVPWKTPTIWEYPVQTSILRPKDVVSGRVLVAGKRDDADVALIIEKGNKYLVNANALHLHTTFVFNQIVAGNLLEPFYGYGVAGRRSAFFALEDTPLVINLPFKNEERIYITKFNSDGKIVKDEGMTYAAPLKTTLKKYDLLIIGKSD